MTEDLRKGALEIVDRLDKAYPEAHLELDFSSPFELLIATILAAQCTDARVNQVTRSLFKKYPNPAVYLTIDIVELEEDIRPTGFYRNKAKSIVACCQRLVEDYDGKIPDTVAEMTKLPGVGRKTANIVLANAMGVPAIGVDTHVLRVANRLGWVNTKNPDKIEAQLCELLPENRWHRGNLVVQWHGRYTCQARQPKCAQCVVYDLCAWAEKDVYKKHGGQP
ncbi:MAG: endonuclease III [bacterium]